MEGFSTDYILERIANMEDGENSQSDFFQIGMVKEDAPENLKDLVALTGTVIGMDYADLGENGYDAYGVYSFLPDNENDPCRTLSIVITLTDQVDSVGIYDMYQVINQINVRIPCGAFVLSDDEKTLYYKNYVQLPKALDNESTTQNVGVRVFDSVACITDWIDVLMGLNDGSMSYDDCINRIQTFAESID